MSSNDKTFPILLQKTWPVVPSPYCLGPWTGNQEPRLYRLLSTYLRPAYSVAAAQSALDCFARSVDQGSTAGVNWSNRFGLAA